MAAQSPRPSLHPGMSAEEFARWYWLKDELQQFARRLEIGTEGAKQALADRIRTHLAGEPPIACEPSAWRSARQLTAPLQADDLVPAGQRCSQVVRAWLTQQIGRVFHFDAPMRDFFRSSDGSKTLNDAVKHWHATRAAGSQQIAAQFEYNRFTRNWRRQHPSSGREALLAAWKEYKNQPIDARGRS